MLQIPKVYPWRYHFSDEEFFFSPRKCIMCKYEWAKLDWGGGKCMRYVCMQVCMCVRNGMRACLCFMVLWPLIAKWSNGQKHITHFLWFFPFFFAVSPDSTYLNFTVTWNNELKLEYGSEVMVPCPGPYVFFICANLQGTGTKGNLTLSQGHRNFSFELFTTLDTRCVRHQKVISLYEKEKVTFSFENKYDEEYIFLEDLQVGLHYLLGARNIITPDFGPV